MAGSRASLRSLCPPLRELPTTKGALLILMMRITLLLATPLLFTVSKFRWSTDAWFVIQIVLRFLIGPSSPSIAATYLAYLSSQSAKGKNN